jgi:hypothetical protein
MYNSGRYIIDHPVCLPSVSISPDRKSYVLGNGPSLNRIDISLLKNKDTISFNRAYIAYQDWGFYPKYYMCIDIRVLQNIVDDINQLIENSPIEHFFLRDVSGTESWNDTHFCTRKKILDSEKVSFISTEDRARKFNNELNFGNLIYWGDVAVCSLQVLYLLGYKEAILLGVDAKYQERKIKGVTREGLKYSSSEDGDINHFRPDYFGKGTEYSKPDGKAHFKSWKRISKLIRANGQFQVFSGSPGSRLNAKVFEFKELEEFM